MKPQEMIDTALELGAAKAAVIPVKEIAFRCEFRKMCEMNSCGMYGKSWMCPPIVGDIDTLIQQAQSYQCALVYQTIGELEDSYDFEGMMVAGQKINDLTQHLRDAFGTALDTPLHAALHLGAGGCRLCETCAKRDAQPCRFPDKALASLEAYGVAVSQLAELCGMKYINGQDTVTYFGAVFFG
ncbi:MAG: DUF2284 domain-containing protein [Ruthenibacterium sp.]